MPSPGPITSSRSRRSPSLSAALAFRLGLVWGIGHALGTVLLVTLLAFVAAHPELGSISAWSQRASGAALVLMGLWSLHLSWKPKRI